VLATSAPSSRSWPQRLREARADWDRDSIASGARRGARRGRWLTARVCLAREATPADDDRTVTPASTRVRRQRLPAVAGAVPAPTPRDGGVRAARAIAATSSPIAASSAYQASG